MKAKMTKKRKRKYKLKKEVKKKLQTIFILFAVVSGIVLCSALFLNQPEYSTEGVMLDEVLDVPVIQQLIPEGHQNRPGIQREIMWIVIHETDNYLTGADALHHADYLCNNLTDVNSWHYTVDENIIVHSLPDEEVGWHAGDKQTDGGGNMNGVGIEMCVNEGNDYSKTKENTAKLVAVLLKSYHLSIDSVKKHQDFSGKNCPAQLLDEEEWKKFLEMIELYRKQL